MSWRDYKELVLTVMTENRKEHKEMCDTLIVIREDIAKLKVKSGVWGVMGGMIPIVVTGFLYFFNKG